MFTNLDPGIAIALISSVASLIVALFGLLAGRKNERDLEALRARLAENQAEKDARRDYEYEARKRLYHEFEPLLFQFVELAESAQRRIASLARTAREGDLETNRGWLSGEGYYFIATIYKVISPLVIVRLMQRRLTLVDLNVDPKINVQYALMKRLYNSFTDDFDLARMAPAIDYNPNVGRAQNHSTEHSSKYYRQGLTIGHLDNIVDALIIQEPGSPARCMNFGEFESAYKMNGSTIRQIVLPLANVFLNFHPQLRPITWRMLIVQVYLYHLLLTISRMSTVPNNISAVNLLNLLDSELSKYNWQPLSPVSQGESAPDDPFKIARLYLEEPLKTLLPSTHHPVL